MSEELARAFEALDSFFGKRKSEYTAHMQRYQEVREKAGKLYKIWLSGQSTCPHCKQVVRDNALGTVGYMRTGREPNPLRPKDT